MTSPCEEQIEKSPADFLLSPISHWPQCSWTSNFMPCTSDVTVSTEQIPNNDFISRIMHYFQAHFFRDS